MQGGHEDLFDIGEEARPVDGAVEDPGRGQASHPQRGEKRTGLPPGARRVVVDAGPAEGPTIPPQEIVRHAGFIEKNQACRIPGASKAIGEGALSRAATARCQMSWLEGVVLVNSRTHDPLTRYFTATSAAFIPASLSSRARSRRSIE